MAVDWARAPEFGLSPDMMLQLADRSSERAGGEGWIRTSVRLRGQIYSLLPLTTRPPLQGVGRRAMWRRMVALSTAGVAPSLALRALRFSTMPRKAEKWSG
jgi:hypothetical protein